jgi:hypothetical protein
MEVVWANPSLLALSDYLTVVLANFERKLARGSHLHAVTEAGHASIHASLHPAGSSNQISPHLGIPTDSIQHHPALENRLAGHQAEHKENDKHNDENSEKYTRDPAGRRRYAGEPEDTGDNGYQEKDEC